VPCCTKSEACPFRGLDCVGSDIAVTRAAASLVELGSRTEFCKTSGCVTRLGASSPTLMPFAHAGVRLQSTGPSIPAVRRDSHDHPLLGFRSPSGFDPLVSPRASRRPAPLLGFVPLQRMSVGGVYVASACGPIRRLRSVRRVSTLSTVCSSTHLAHAFRRKQHSWGSPFRGFPSRTGPQACRSQVAFLALFPRPALSPPR
jgi:hypothetical protein